MGWTVLTNLGDSAIMVPAVLAVAAWLCAVRARKVAVLWLALCGMSVCVVAATKIAFMGWGLGIRSIDFTGISGHATLSMAVLPFAGFLIGGKISERLRLALTGMGFLLALGIAVSRVVLMFHSPSEVIAGCTVGGIVALAMAVFARRLTDPSQTMNTALAIGLAVLMIGANGQRAPSEGMLGQMAMFLSGRDRPFTRADWRRIESTADSGTAAAMTQGLRPTYGRKGLDASL